MNDTERLDAAEAALRELTRRLTDMEQGEFHPGGEGFRIGTLRLFEKFSGALYHLHQRDEDGTESDLTDALSLRGVDVSEAAPTAAQVLVYDAALDEWVPSAPSAPGAHALGGAAHTADTLANLNTKVSDATLDDHGDSRPPTGHTHDDRYYTESEHGGVSPQGHHALITLHADLQAALLALAGQELDLDTQLANKVFAGPASGGAVKPAFRSLVELDIPSAFLTAAEHTAIGNGSPHHAALTLGDAMHSLAGQVLSGADAAAGQKGHLKLAGHLGGTAALPDVRGLRESGGQALDMGAVADGKYLKRSGTDIVGDAGGGAEAIDDLSDVDTSGAEAPDKSEVLKWNGSNWVPAVYNYNFTFSIASFSDGEATTQLIGTGVWEANEAVIFAATYNNGPPTSADVLMSIHGAAYNDVGHMDGPAYTGGKSYDGAINYPDAKDKYLRFRLDATDGADPDIEYETAIYFRNKIYWGVIAKADTFTEADIEGLGTSITSNAINRSFNLAPGVGEYMVYAYPTSYTAMDEGSDYENDGGTDFKFNGIAIAMTRDNAALSITNSAGFQEDYDVYVSDVANLGNHTFQAHTSGLTIDPLYYGKTVKTDTFLEADIEGLANSEITNDNTQVWDSVTTGAGEYMLFAFPKRLGIPTFWVGGFEGGFEAPETVSVTNANGWTEDYYAWRSTNSNLGATVVETK